MKKIFALALALTIPLGLFAGCGKEQSKGSSTATDVDIQDIIDGKVVTGQEWRETLIVGFDERFPPFGYKDENGEYVGFDLDLAAEVCERQGWELELKPINWASKDKDLKSGDIDCIWNGFSMNERESQYTFSDPYLDNTQVILTVEGQGVNTIADLAGKAVAVQSGSSAEKEIENEDKPNKNKAVFDSFSELLKVADYDEAFQKLDSGDVDAIALDHTIAEYWLVKESDKGYVVLNEVITSEQYGIGFRLGETSLRNAVMMSINEMVADGSFMEIAEKWGLEEFVCLGK